MGTTRVHRHINAAPSRVYHALTNTDAVARWMVPDGMSLRMHDFRPEVGGGLRVSLTYDSPDAVGKTSQHTDTYHGRFVSLDPERKVEQVLEFETSDLALQGKMRLVSRSSMRRGEQTCSCCTTGWRMALAKLAALVETDP